MQNWRQRQTCMRKVTAQYEMYENSLMGGRHLAPFMRRRGPLQLKQKSNSFSWYVRLSKRGVSTVIWTRVNFCCVAGPWAVASQTIISSHVVPRSELCTDLSVVCSRPILYLKRLVKGAIPLFNGPALHAMRPCPLLSLSLAECSAPTSQGAAQCGGDEADRRQQS